jgi:hypothetical protein
MSDDESLRDAYLPPGTPVRYDGVDGGSPEYGVVIHCWFAEQVGGYDCYVAFFGADRPEGEPAKPPYVLRYAATSLSVLKPRS